MKCIIVGLHPNKRITKLEMSWNVSSLIITPTLHISLGEPASSWETTWKENCKISHHWNASTWALNYFPEEGIILSLKWDSLTSGLMNSIVPTKPHLHKLICHILIYILNIHFYSFMISLALTIEAVRSFQIRNWPWNGVWMDLLCHANTEFYTVLYWTVKQ